jgi:hypothetical protein
MARLIFTPAAAVSICTCNPRTPTRSSIARRCVRRPTRSMRIERTDHFGCNERNPLGQAYRDALGAVAHLFTHRCNGGTRSALTRIRQRYNLTSWRTGPVVPLVHLQTSPEVLDQGGRLESALALPSLHVSKCCNSEGTESVGVERHGLPPASKVRNAISSIRCFAEESASLSLRSTCTRGSRSQCKQVGYRLAAWRRASRSESNAVTTRFSATRRSFEEAPGELGALRRFGSDVAGRMRICSSSFWPTCSRSPSSYTMRKPSLPSSRLT